MTRDTRSFQPPQPPRSAERGAYHLLVIGIDDYTHFPPLETAVNDAKSIRDALTTHYGFSAGNVTELYNKSARGEAITKAFEAYHPDGEKALTEEDSLLIYFAGHGAVDRFTKEGAWVPIDAKTSAIGCVENAKIKAYLGGIAARHVLIISDSCFAGDFFQHRDAPQAPGKNDAYMQQAFGKTSRQALTSGGLEPVSDGGFGGNSVFAHFLLTALKQNTSPYLFPVDLHERVKGGVSQNARQTPRFGQLFGARGEEGGEFVFFLENQPAPTTPPPVKPRPKPAGTIWLSEGESNHGPYAEADLVDMIADKTISAATLLWKAGMMDWQEIGTLPEWQNNWPDSARPAPRTRPTAKKKEEKLRVTCPNCKATYEIGASNIPPAGRDLECSACQHVWFVGGDSAAIQSETDNFDVAHDPAHIRQLEMKARSGNIEANYEMGCYHFYGLSGRRNQTKAAQYLSFAAKKGHAESHFVLGIMYETKTPCTKQNLREAFRHYDTSKAHGLAVAKLAVGKFHNVGVDLRGPLEGMQEYRHPKLYQGVGFKLIKEAAKEDCAIAEVELGLNLYTGRFVPRDPKRAEKHIRRAAELGDPLALKMLDNPAELQKAKAEWHANIDRLQNAAEQE